jgi:hypothetical protein
MEEQTETEDAEVSSSHELRSERRRLIASLTALALGAVALGVRVAFHLPVHLDYLKLPTYPARLAFQWRDFNSLPLALISVLALVLFLFALFHLNKRVTLQILAAALLLISTCFASALSSVTVIAIVVFLIGFAITSRTQRRAFGITLSAVLAVGLCVIVPDVHRCARSPLSRAKSDMRTIAVSLEAYYVDYGAYPMHTLTPADRLQLDIKTNMPAFGRFEAGKTGTLTTPIAYMTSMPLDPFSRIGEEKHTFAYYAPEGKGWILLSAGYDGVFDIDWPMLQRLYADGPPEFNRPDLLFCTYDVTNGASSTGDIWRMHE